MRYRTRMIAAAAVTAALAAGSTAALASTTGATPRPHAKAVSASAKAGHSKAAQPAGDQQVQAMITAAVARELHVSAARATTALRPLFAAGRAQTSSPAFVAAARSLGVSPQQLAAALMHAKQSLAAGKQVKQRASRSKIAGPSSAQERQAQNAMTATVAGRLHVSVARVGAALRPLFATGQAQTSSPAFVAAARSLGVSPQQLATALMHAKQSLATGR